MAAGGNIGSWVPQLFYDLIARVTPGFFIYVAFLIIFVTTDEQHTKSINKYLSMTTDFSLWKNFPTTLAIISGYAISYMTGFLVRGIYCIFLFDDDFNEKYIKYYDEIKFADDKAGSRLSKLRAEIHMCTVLGTGWIIAYLFFLIKTAEIISGVKQFIILIIFSALIGILCKSYSRIRKIFYREIDHYKRFKNTTGDEKKLKS